jgi:hypothetical protein
MWRSSLVFVFACLLYANTLQNGFVLGDVLTVTQSDYSCNWAYPPGYNLAHIYNQGNHEAKANSSRFSTAITYSLDELFWGLNPIGFHLTNVLLFGLLCLVLFLLLTKLQWLHPNLSLLLVLLFAAHPINSEVVAHVSYRYEILGFLFFAFALRTFNRYFNKQLWGYLIISALLSLLALLSNEANLLLLLLFPMLAWYRKPELKTVFKSSWWIVSLFVLIPFLKFSNPYYFTWLSPMENQLLEASSSTIWATKFGLWGKYLQLLFIPYPLRFDYSFNTIPLLNWSSSEIWTLLSFLVLSLVALITAFRKQSGAGFKMMFAFLFFVLALIPSSNPFFALPHSFSEHHVFIPSFGFLLFLFLSIQEFGWSEKAFTQRFWIISIAVCILMAASITFFRNQDWKSNESLLTADIKHLKSNALANTLLAALYHEKGYEAKTTGEKRTFYESAIRLDEEAQEIHPSEQGYFELALLYGKTERYEGMLKACLLHIELTEAQGKSPSEAILILKAKAESKLDLQDT